jgi:hypothetical protein
MTRTKRTLLALLAATALAACGGSSGSDGPASPSTSAGGSASTALASEHAEDRPVAAVEARPEGDWQLTRYHTEQASGGDVLRVVRRAWHAEPTCDEGACDVDVTPAGPHGTFLGPGYPVPDGEPAGEPFTMTYEDGHYRSADEEPSSCALADGGFSEDRTLATFRQSFDLTFRKGSGDEPDRWYGTLEETATATAAGRAAGCVDDGKPVTNVVSGVPADMVFDNLVVDGTYAVSYVFGDASAPDLETTPDLLWYERAASLSQAWSVTGACEDTNCAIGMAFTDGAGRTRSFALTPGSGGWSGKTDPVVGDCKVNGGSAVVVPGGYTNSVEVRELRIVDAFEGKAAVLVGRFDERSTPSELAAAADPVNCYPQYRTGQVILVNTDLVRDGA